MLEKTLPHWIETHPAEAAEWWAGRPVDLGNINLLQSMLRRVAENDPAAARSWVEQVDDPTYRQLGNNLLRSLDP